MSKQARVALITGANKGLGLETARQLGKLGMIVIIGSRNECRGQAAATLLRGEGIDARAICLDVDSPGECQEVADWIAAEFGQLDVLVNNAAVLKDCRFRNQTSTTSMEVLRGTFRTNFFGTVCLTQMLLPLLEQSEAGRIVNLSSVLGSNTLQATPGSSVYDAKTFAYDASKAALNSFTIHLAHELRNTRIKVNSAHPGWVKTELGGAGAEMEIPEGARTSVTLATLPEDGPTGAFLHLGVELPW